MSVNSSFAGILHRPSNSSFSPVDCLSFRMSMLILTTFSIIDTFFIFPLAAFIVYLGYQRRKQQRCISTAAASHSDSFTYHMIAMEIVALLGCLVYCVGVNTNIPKMTVYSFNIFFSFWSSKTSFLTLTCVEYYLAVVHPVTYRRLKNTCGVRIRNISIGCVWLLCCLCAILVALNSNLLTGILYFWLLTFGLIVICFCCTCVLCGLSHRVGGGVGGVREQANQIKQRAFNTVVIIMGVLWLCLGGMLVCNALEDSGVLSTNDGCALVASTVWFSLPSSFVLPLLFLHRAGKLPGCKHSVN